MCAWQTVAVQPAVAQKKARLGSADELAAQIKDELADVWLPRIYREKIMPMRTRSHALPAAKAGTEVSVQHTLLGVELKVGRKRLSCPDLATARYLAVFARLGVAAVAVPYDITRTSPLADELESSWQHMLLLIEHRASERTAALRARLRRTLIGAARGEVEEAGAGAAVPQFNQNTKQRLRRA
ncbi:MAG: hypothetical protein ACJ74W_08710 [Pyrinomonadaceae bacterium]